MLVFIVHQITSPKPKSSNVEERFLLDREIVRYSSVSLSLTLSRNEKVEQHIRKKTHKTNVLRFWVKGIVIFLCWSDSVLIFVYLPGVLPQFSQQVARKSVSMWNERLLEIQIDISLLDSLKEKLSIKRRRNIKQILTHFKFLANQCKTL